MFEKLEPSTLCLTNDLNCQAIIKIVIKYFSVNQLIDYELIVSALRLGFSEDFQFNHFCILYYWYILKTDNYCLSYCIHIVFL